MGLLSPFFLPLLGLGAIILALHVRRRKSIVLPSVRIWKQLKGAERQQVRKLQLPQINILLVLQVFVLVAIVTALVRPIYSNVPGSDHLIIVMDGSSAMQTSDDGRIRFDIARDKAGRLASAARSERISVIRTGAMPSVEIARQKTHPDTIVPQIEAILPGDGPTDWIAVSSRLTQLIQSDEVAHVVYFSSLPLPDNALEISPGVSIEHVKVGSLPRDATFEAKISGSNTAHGVWSVDGNAFFSGGVSNGTLEVDFNPRESSSFLNLVTMRVEADAADGNDLIAESGPYLRSAPFNLDASLPGPGLLRLTLSGEGLSHSRRTWFEVRDTTNFFQVLYLGEGQQPLVRALQSVPGVTVFQADALPQDLTRFGLVVIDDVEVPRRPETNTLWIAGARLDGMSEAQPLSLGEPDNWRNDHPLSDAVSWAGISAARAVAISVPDDADILLEHKSAPLVAARTSAHGREVWLAFNPSDSNWPLETSFPGFALNLMRWVGHVPSVVPVSQPCIVAQACSIDPRYLGGTITNLESSLHNDDQVFPDRRAREISDDVIFPRTAGLYLLEKGGRSEHLVVDAPAWNNGAGAADNGQATQASYFTADLWPWLAWAALFLLLVEGFLAGRGQERFLRLAALSRLNPLSGRRRWLLALRAAAVGMVILALTAAPVAWPNFQNNLAIVSAPPLLMNGEDQLQRAVDRARSEANTRFSGRQLSSVTRSPSHGVTLGLGERDESGNNDGGLATSLPDALELARATIPRGVPAKVALEDDPSVTLEEIARIRALLEANDIDLYLLQQPPLSSNEITLVGIETPTPLYVGETFPVTFRVHATRDTTTEVLLSQDGVPLFQETRTLNSGHNRFDVIVRDIDAETKFYDASLTPADDTITRNNRDASWVTPRVPDRILLLTHQEIQGASFAEMLEEQGFEVDVLRPDFAPFQLRNWLNFQAVILLDVASSELAFRQQELIEEVVAEHGAALFILGGEKSFGPGGYLETTLEQLSPLSSRVPREAPEASLVFVLDRSGSMQQRVGNSSRLDIAKRATLAAVDLLNEQSRVGIVAFDAQAEIIMPISALGDGEDVATALERFDAGGGTAIYPGLVLARDILEGEESAIKHVIVMTDGMSQPGDFPQVLSELRDMGVSVSGVAIGVGSGPGQETVRNIANLGGGSFHASDNFEALPSILVQEAMLLSGSPIETLVSQPKWTGTQESFVMGLPEQTPEISGFVLTSEKPEANLLMVTPDSDGNMMPLLASWRYGNGNVLAFSSSAAGEWTRQWQETPAYPQLWSQALRQFLPAGSPRGLDLTVARVGDLVMMRVQANDDEGRPRSELIVEATVRHDVIGTEMRIPMRESEPGVYSGRFQPTELGDYSISAHADEFGTSVTRLHVAYPSRYDFSRSGSALRNLVEAADGTILGPDDPIFTSASVRWGTVPGWPIWLLFGLSIFMADLILRYSSLSNRLHDWVGRITPTRENEDRMQEISKESRQRHSKLERV